MWSLEVIKAMNAEAGRRSWERKKEPVRVTFEDLVSMPPFPFPFLGGGCAAWDERLPRVGTLCCDVTGHGKPEDSALTAVQLKAVLGGFCSEAPIMVAIAEQGHHQVHLAVWREGPPPGSNE